MTTAAHPIGNCPRCGNMKYAGLVHHCGTALVLPKTTPPLKLVLRDGVLKPRTSYFTPLATSPANGRPRP